MGRLPSEAGIAGRKLAAVWGWLRGRRARVLLYHSISELGVPLATPPRVFREQISWLARAAYRVISSGELIDAIRSRTDLHRTAVITFDDALNDFCETAAPILLDAGLAATVFVPTGRIGGTLSWRTVVDPMPLMSTEQLARLVELGFELGSHTAQHVDLPSLDEATMRQELQSSLQTIREVAGSERVALAYPFGRGGDREQRVAREVGYAGAYLGGGLWGNGVGSNLYAMTRVPVGGQADLRCFAALARGRSDLIRPWVDLGRHRLAP
jgi:peptidoglycan/xylan/chitin deacetylase (PgdA/CDA1 family)